MKDNSIKINLRDKLAEKAIITESNNKKVSLNGWIGKIRNLGKLVFFELKNGDTEQQIVVKDETEINKINSLNSGDLIRVKGILKLKKKKALEEQKSEILLESFDLINKTTPLPFEIKNDIQLKDDNRYRYRYLDLRKNESRKVIIIKHELLNFIRNFFYHANFTEIETPILAQSSPEGAKSFIVQSNIKGKFYTLPQSPQIFKQLLMVAGFEKYYQIAKTFRNEDARSNRQLEFLQLDIEISFPEKGTFLKLIEKMMQRALIEVFKIKSEKISFETFTFQDCMEKYGSDKPDLRNPLIITELSSKILANLGTNNKLKEERNIFIKRKPENSELKTLISQIKYETSNTYEIEWIVFYKEKNKLEIIASSKEIKEINNLAAGLESGFYVIAHGKKELVNLLLGKLRILLGKNIINESLNEYRFLWITDWPLFKYSSQESKIVALRHPFTIPKSEELSKLFDKDNDFLTILTESYDLVCNGEELASGSLRIYKKEIQEKVFEILGFNKSETEKHFSYFLKALGFAAPPHGGIGIGIERMLTVFLGLKSLKETIAFPKNIDGTCSSTRAPNSL